MLHLHHLIATYGYGVVMLFVGIEGVGIPLPGETTLITAAIIAGTSRELDIFGVVLASIGGALIGDNLGFWLGRLLGTRLLQRYGHYVGLQPAHLKLGQYLFKHYGGWLVGFGRFVTVLRTLAPFLAGANRMPWPRFFLFNLCGSVLWSAALGAAAYEFGKAIHRLMGPVGLCLGAVTVIGIVVAFRLVRRRYQDLQAAAEREFPDPPA
jgi:membrane protein DedA with SNARE-associated domain